MIYKKYFIPVFFLGLVLLVLAVLVVVSIFFGSQGGSCESTWSSFCHTPPILIYGIMVLFLPQTWVIVLLAIIETIIALVVRNSETVKKINVSYIVITVILIALTALVPLVALVRSI